MGRYQETETEYTSIKSESGVVYDVTVSVTKVEIRKGTYSQAALDPDEYYGEWEVYADVIGADVYNENTDDEAEWVDVDDLPLWVVDYAKSEFEE